MSRTITLTIAIPDGAKYMTTDEDGRVQFWSDRPCLDESLGMWVRGDYGCVRFRAPFANWRDSLVDLTQEAS